MKTENAKEWLEKNSPIKHKENNSPYWVEHVMQQYADQKTQQLKEENDKLKDYKKWYREVEVELNQLKQEKEADRKRIEELERQVRQLENKPRVC